MGRIFTFEQIQKGLIPTRTNFALVIERVTAKLGKSRYVIASQFCGSVAYGTQAERSDVDFVFVYRRAGARRVKQIERELYEFARKLSVPLELIAIDERMARSRMHTISASFMQHLTLTAAINGYARSPVVAALSPRAVSAKEDVRHYLIYKINEHEKGVRFLTSEDDARRCRFLHGVLDDPIHLARKILWYEKQCPTPDTGQAVVRRYLQSYPRQLTRMLERITSADLAYRSFLASLLSATSGLSVSRAHYERVLAPIEALAPITLEFLKANALMLARRRR
jgi:predicted nucleotidyltransferase